MPMSAIAVDKKIGRSKLTGPTFLAKEPFSVPNLFGGRRSGISFGLRFHNRLGFLEMTLGCFQTGINLAAKVRRSILLEDLQLIHHLHVGANLHADEAFIEM